MDTNFHLKIDVSDAYSLSGWFQYALIYLGATKQLMNDIYKERWGGDSSPIIYEEKRSYIIPLLFMFNHSLELILKGFMTETYNETELKIDNTHDIKKLFNEFKNKFIKKLKSKKDIPDLERLECIVLKHYKRELIFKTPTKIELTDPANEVYRYPFSRKLNITINPGFSISLTKQDINEIVSDIKTTEEISSKIIETFTGYIEEPSHERKTVI